MSREIRVRMEAAPPAVLEQRLRDAVCRMSRGLSRGTPIKYRPWRADVTRSMPKQKPMGHYPAYAWECLRSGAPIADVIAPLDELRDALIAAASDDACVKSAIREETAAEGHANESEVEVAFSVERPSRTALESWLERARAHRATIDRALCIGARLLYQTQRGAVR